MNILYCGDSHMQNGLLLSALSLTRAVPEPLHLYIVTAHMSNSSKHFLPISPEYASSLGLLLQSKNPQNKLDYFDITALFSANPPLANLDSRFTPACMLRLYIDSIDGLPDRLLYLDEDVLARRDPSVFYHQDFHASPLIGVLDHYGKWFFHHSLTHLDYINSGVLLLNLPLIKEKKLFAAARQRCRTKKMFLPDQSAINKIVKKRRLANRRFNDQHGPHEDTVFIHFSTRLQFFPVFKATTIKPWDISAVQNQLNYHDQDDLFLEYQSLS